MARFDHFAPCMPGQPKWSSCDSGKALFPISVVITGSRPALGQRQELVTGVGVQRAAADVQDGLLGLGDRPRGLADLEWMHLRGWLPARQVDGLRVDEVQLVLLHVARHVDEHRSASARASHVERRLHHLGDLTRVLDEPGVLDDRHRHAGDVALLERIGADQMRPHLAGDADERASSPSTRPRSA